MLKQGEQLHSFRQERERRNELLSFLRKSVFKDKEIVFQLPEIKGEMLVGIVLALIESERARPGETSITKLREECIFKKKTI